MTWIKIARTAAAMAAITLTGACASAGGAPLEEPSASDEPAVSLIVENQNWQDAKIYLAGPGTRVRLGTVSSMATGRMQIPEYAWQTGAFQLEVELIGSQANQVTHQILATSGDQVLWSLRNSLALSSVSVR